MASTPKCFYRGVLPSDSSPTSITVPAGKRWILTNVITAPQLSYDVFVTIAVDGIPLMKGLKVELGDTIEMECTQVVDAGSVITVSANSTVANAAVMHVSGIEQDVYQ